MKSYPTVQTCCVLAIGLAFVFVANEKRITAQTWTGPDANGNITNANSGNVGVGISPATRFHIKLGSAYDALTIEESQYGRQFRIVAPSATTGATLFRNTFTGADFVWERNPAGDGSTFIEDMRLSAGKLGIGTYIPAYKLDVVGGLNVAGSSYWNGHFIQDQTTYRGVALGYDTSGQIGLIAAETASAAAPSSLAFWTHNGSTWAERVRFAANGNVGIGTTSPGTKLHVEAPTAGFGATVVGSFFTPDTVNGGSRGIQILGTGVGTAGGDVAVGFAKNTGAPYAFYSSGGTGAANRLVTITDGGNVGIGTIGPYWKLTVNDPTVGYNSDAGNIAISNSSDTTKRLLFGIDTNLGANGSGFIQSVKSGTGVTPLLLNANGGNVGIGTPNPGYKLDVNGNTNVTGNLNITASGAGTGNIVAAGTINAKYQDVAEWVPSSKQLPAGTVVVLDSTKSNQVTSSTVSYDTRVAGVVSEQPGIALGEKSESKVLVATTGRVRVKVDASKGAIHIGDLLVTSDIPGVAMKSEPVEFAGRKMHMPGTLIGKALEPLEKGKGEILVLLSLQ